MPDKHQYCLSVVENEKKKSMPRTPQLSQQIGPILQHMLKAMEDKGCYVPKDFFVCKPCERADSIAYWDSREGIVVCEDNVTMRSQIQASLIHEFVHAFDYCRAKLDPNNCQHLACTEVEIAFSLSFDIQQIRAANLSGDCTFAQELLRGMVGRRWRGHHQQCVRRRAELSVSMHPACSSQAKEAVDKVWAACLNDLEPFDYLP